MKGEKLTGIIHIAGRMRHHSPHSGYDRLSDYISCQKFERGLLARGLDLIPDRILGLVLKKSNLYLIPELKQELDLQLRSWFTGDQVYHFLYGENEFRHFHPPRGSKLFVTYHFPPKKYEQYFMRPPDLKRVNGIIVVGTNQIDYFSKWVSKEKIVFIPHGVDIEFFKPDRMKLKEEKILFVGNHLRDFEMMRNVIEQVSHHQQTVRFTIVTLKENLKLFRGLKNTELLSDINEIDLLNLYQTHIFLFLPLIDGTANNSLLEAASCGLPIITTDVGAVRDYLDDKSAIFIPPQKINLAVSAIMDLLQDSRKCEEMGGKARERMVNFDWRVIAKKMMDLYETF